mgnify:CR=1 FL=1
MSNVQEILKTIKEKEKGAIKVYYGGYPVEAVNPPWDGGFTWANDSNGIHGLLFLAKV